MRHERRERVVGDARAGRRHRADERRLADVREAEQAGVGEHAELEPERPLLAGLAGLRVARGLSRRCREVLVAEPAAAAVRDDHLVAVGAKVGEQVFRLRLVVVDERARRNPQHQVLAVRA